MDWYSQQRDFAAIVPVSARNGDGVDLFERAIIEQLPDGEALYPEDYLTDQPERVLAAETVREKVLQHTRAELPFTTAVVVDQFDEVSEPGRLLIYCSILVERQSQKPIVIGPGGALVKQIGTEARRDLEAFFGSRVYLDLHVKVRADWRENDRILDQAGVAPPTKSRR
jgi:GTP-binding protein Era